MTISECVAIVDTKYPPVARGDPTGLRGALERTPAAARIHVARAAAAMTKAGRKAVYIRSTLSTVTRALRHPKLADLDLANAQAMDFDPYFTARDAPTPHYRRGQRDAAGKVRAREDEPLEHPNQAVTVLNRFFDYANLAVRVDPQGAKKQKTIHEVKWRSHDELRRLIAACGMILVDLALLAALVVGIHWHEVGSLRCSHVRRINGRAYLIGPNAPALLGVYAYPLEELKEARLRKAKPGEDPYLFWAPYTDNEPMTPKQLDDHVGVLIARTGIQRGLTTDTILLTGQASLLDYGVGSDYLHWLSPESPLEALDRLWNIVDDVSGSTQNLGIGKHNGLPPFTVGCRCGQVRFDMPGSCTDCDARVPTEKLDRAHYIEVQLHRQITDLLRLRGESNDDRDRLFLETKT